MQDCYRYSFFWKLFKYLLHFFSQSVQNYSFIHIQVPAAILQFVQNCSFIHSLSVSTRTYLKLFIYLDWRCWYMQWIYYSVEFRLQFVPHTVSTRIDFMLRLALCWQCKLLERRTKLQQGNCRRDTMYQYNEDALCLLKQVCLHASFTVHVMIHIFDSKLPSSCLLLQLQASVCGLFCVPPTCCVVMAVSSRSNRNIRRRQVTKQGISCVLCQVLVLGAE